MSKTDKQEAEKCRCVRPDKCFCDQYQQLRLGEHTPGCSRRDEHNAPGDCAPD